MRLRKSEVFVRQKSDAWKAHVVLRMRFSIRAAGEGVGDPVRRVWWFCKEGVVVL